MFKTSASISVQYDGSYSPFKGTEWKKAVDWLAYSGFDGAELILSDPNLLDAEEISNYIFSKNLKISTLSTGMCCGLEGMDMTSPSADVRERTMRRLFDDIDFSVKIGNPNVTVGLLRGKGGKLPFEKEYELLKYGLSKACDYAAKRNVIINFEPLNMYETKLINSTQEAVKLLDEIGNPENCGILYDTHHANIDDANVLDTVKEYLPRISHIHYSDSNRRLPGEGNYDYKGLLKILKEGNYDKFVSLEVLNKPSAEYIIENAGKRMKEAITE